MTAPHFSFTAYHARIMSRWVYNTDVFRAYSIVTGCVYMCRLRMNYNEVIQYVLRAHHHCRVGIFVLLYAHIMIGGWVYLYMMFILYVYVCHTDDSTCWVCMCCKRIIICVLRASSLGAWENMRCLCIITGWVYLYEYTPTLLPERSSTALWPNGLLLIIIIIIILVCDPHTSTYHIMR